MTEERPPIRVAPERKFTAEVVVLVTTLGVKRHEYNESNRAKDLLEIMRAHYKMIDFNLDSNIEVVPDHVTSNRVNQADLDVIRKLYTQKKLMQDPNDGLIILPQILIDGVNVGDFADLQALVDEDLLDNILLRKVCPKCLRQRTSGLGVCRFCDEVFQELMPNRHTIDDVLATFPDQHEDDDDAQFVLLSSS